MYEDISQAIASEGKSCDTLAAEFTQAVNRFSPQVQAWARSQAAKDEAMAALDEARLKRLTGDRMPQARSAVQTAMGRCMQNAAFQQALQRLAAASSP